MGQGSTQSICRQIALRLYARAAAASSTLEQTCHKQVWLQKTALGALQQAQQERLWSLCATAEARAMAEGGARGGVRGTHGQAQQWVPLHLRQGHQEPGGQCGDRRQQQQGLRLPKQLSLLLLWP